MNGAIDMRAANEPQGSAATILVVEDADSVRDVIRKLLVRQGYSVLMAANAVEAILLFGEHASIDVLLTDVVMPDACSPSFSASALIPPRHSPSHRH